jgi:hypothetical protein
LPINKKMSQDDIGRTDTHTALVTLIAGVGAPVVTPFFGANSQLVSIIRKAYGAGGQAGAGVPACRVAYPNGFGAGVALGVTSSSNTDTGIYQVTWVNNYTTSDYYTQGGSVAVPVVQALNQEFLA